MRASLEIQNDKGEWLMDIRFLGHACFELTEGDTRVLVDPFLTGNPKAGAAADELEPTHIFLT
ncbi:MAG: MBL fold metallo-hydrolase, partial [Thermoleophilaceae bacterium]